MNNWDKRLLALGLSTLPLYAFGELQSISESDLANISGKAGVTIEASIDSTYSSLSFQDKDMPHKLALIDGTALIPEVTMTLDVVSQIPGSGIFANDNRDAIAIGVNIPSINISNTTVVSATPDSFNPAGDLKQITNSMDFLYQDYVINPNTWSDKNTANSRTGRNDEFTVSIDGDGSDYAIVGRYRLDSFGRKIDYVDYSDDPVTSLDWEWQQSTSGCKTTLSNDCKENDFKDGKITDTRNEYVVLRVYGDESSSESVEITYDAPRTQTNEAADDAVLIVLDEEHNLFSDRCRGSATYCSDDNDIFAGDKDGDEQFTVNLRGGTTTISETIFLGDPTNQYLMQTNISGTFNISGSAYIFAN